MKTVNKIFQKICAISVNKKTAKNIQAKIFDNVASWWHALLGRLHGEYIMDFLEYFKCVFLFIKAINM